MRVGYFSGVFFHDILGHHFILVSSGALGSFRSLHLSLLSQITVVYIQSCPLDWLSCLSLISLGTTFMLGFLAMVITDAGIHLRDYN